MVSLKHSQEKTQKTEKLENSHNLAAPINTQKKLEV